MIKKDQTWKLPTTPHDEASNEDQTRSDTEIFPIHPEVRLQNNKDCNRNFLVCPLETRNELGMLVEIPSSL